MNLNERNDGSQTAKSRFEKMNLSRSVLLQAYERYSAITVPWVCTEIGYNENSQQLQDSWTSFGHHCVTNLVNKLMLGLFSPTKPFFRLQASEDFRNGFIEQGGDVSILEEALSKAEMKCQRYLEKIKLRTYLIEALTNLIVIGTALIKLDKKGKHRCYNVRKYVQRRNFESDVVEFITAEKMCFESLTNKIRDLPMMGKYKDEDKICLYEWFMYDEDKDRWSSTMWVDNDKLPGQFDGGWKKEDFPYIHLSWELPDGQNYGVGHVQRCYADLQKHQNMTRSETEMGMMTSEHRWLLNPGSSIDPSEFEESENGSVIPGREGDLTLVNLGSGSINMASITASIQNQERAIATSFLMTTAITRQAERVTAEEIRMQVGELEKTLVGVYNRISEELQLPIAYFLLNNAEEDGLKVDGKDIQPIIITGSDAVSRSGDVENIAQSLQVLGALNNLPPAVLQTLNMSNINKKVFAGFGVDTTEVVLSDEQIAANMQMQMSAQMAGAEGPAPGTTPTTV